MLLSSSSGLFTSDIMIADMTIHADTRISVRNVPGHWT